MADIDKIDTSDNGSTSSTKEIPEQSTVEEVSIDTNSLSTTIKQTETLVLKHNDTSEPQEKEAVVISSLVNDSRATPPDPVSSKQNDIENVSINDTNHVPVAHELNAFENSPSVASQTTSHKVDQQQMDSKSTHTNVDKTEAIFNDAMNTRSENPTINDVPDCAIDALTIENKCEVPAVQIRTNTKDTEKMVSVVGAIVKDSIDKSNDIVVDDISNSISNQLANKIESKCDNVDSDRMCFEDAANDKNVSSNEIISKPEQLDSESDGRNDKEKNIYNDHVAENCTRDCDSSDTLDKNIIGLIDGAINVVSSGCGPNENNRKQKDVIDIETGTKSKKTVVTNNVEFAPVKIDIEPPTEAPIDASQEKSSEEETAIETENEKKEQELVDERTVQIISKSTKDDENCSKPDKIVVNELNNGATLNYCINLNACEKESTPSSETKYAYNFIKNVSSPEIAPKVFKDKFKKSLEIMEKFKQETYQQKSVTLDVHKPPMVPLKNTDHESNVKKEQEKITLKNSQSEENMTHNIIEVCDLTEEGDTPLKSGEISRTTNEQTIVGESFKPPVKENESTQNDRIYENGTADRELNSIQTTTRTIIISPQNEIQQTNCDTECSFISKTSTSNPISLYINNPDFSSSLRSSVCDLSELKMKTPDFSRLGRASELQVPNPDFTKVYDKLYDTNHRRSPTLREVNPSNFAEISKKYNFISDLQLKNPTPLPSNANDSNSSTCRSLYVQPPNFNNTRLRNRIENESDNVEEPTPHIIHKNMYRTQADSSSKSCRSPSLSAAHGDQSLIPNDSTMHMQVQKTLKVQILQSKETPYPTKPSTPLHTMQNVQSSNVHLSMLHERQRFDAITSNSQNYQYSQNQTRDKSLPQVHKPYTESFYQRNAIIPSHAYQSPIVHAFHHRDVSMSTAKNPSKNLHNYEYFAQSSQSERTGTAMPIHVQTADHHSLHTRSASNLIYPEQSRIKQNVHPMHESPQPSSSSHINYQASKTTTMAKLIPTSASVSACASMQNLNKPNEFYNQMNPPQKWPSQSRITQSPISTASSPHSIGSQNAQISQSPVSASSLPYPIHRQSPSYPSPHPTPSPSPFSYPHGTSSPVPIKQSIKLPSNTQTNSNAAQNLYPSRHSSDMYGVPAVNAIDKKYSQHSISPKLSNESRSQQKIEANRFIEIQHESRQHDHQSTASHHRSLSLPSKSSIKTETTTAKYSDRLDYKRPNTIVDPLVYRQSSEADLNYQIIKKTLNKEIPTPSFNRKNADINSTLPMSSSRLNVHPHAMITSQNVNEIVMTADSNQHHLLHNNIGSLNRPTNLENKHGNESFVHSDKLNITIQHNENLTKLEQNNLHYQRSLYSPNNQSGQVQQMENHTNYEQRSMQSIQIANSNHTVNQYATALNHRNPIAVGPSLHTKVAIQEVVNMIPNHPAYETIVRPTTETRSIKISTLSQPTANLTTANDVSSTKSGSSTIFAPKKRESPLDLSVKTVKTKADSTGVYDYSMPMRRHDSIPSSLKVDFAPNFTSSPANDMRNHNAHRLPNRAKTSAGTPNANISPTNHPHMIQPSHYNQPSYSQMENSPRPPNTATSDNKVIELDTMYKETIVEQNACSVSKNTTKTNLSSGETKNRKDSKMPMIFGQKPEELKNFKPELHGSQNETNASHKNEFSNVASNKTIDILSSSTSQYHDSKDRVLHQGRSNQSYQSMSPSLQRHNEHASQNEHVNDVIQIIPQSRAHAQHEPHGAAMSNDKPKPMTYPHYNSYDAMHHNHASYAFNQPQPNMDYEASSSALNERFKANHQHRGGSDVHYSVSQKRPAENGLNDQSINPLKQMRYDHSDKIKYPHAQANQYYGIPSIASSPMQTPVDRVQIYASPFAEIPNQKPIEKAINTPVIVQPKHTKSVDTEYQYNSNEQLDNKHSLPSRPILYEQEKTTHSYRSFPDYGNDFKTKELFIAAEDKLKPSETSQTNLTMSYQQAYQANKEHFGTASTSAVAHGAQSTLKQYRSVVNKSGKDPYVFEMSVIKSAEYPKPDSLPPIEPFRYVNSNTAPKPVDQSVISKLRNNLELKEIEKQKQMKSQNNFEKLDEDSNKSEIASIIAARIRTKGELKGFTMDAEQNAMQSKSFTNENKIDPSVKSEKIISKGESKFAENMSGFDLMDWGSTCNDFLKQLQHNEDKQRSRAQRRFNLNELTHENSKESIDQSITLGTATAVTTIESNDKNASEEQDIAKLNPSTVDDSSSDEDKPLLLLRQQSLNETLKNHKNNATNDNDINDDSSSKGNKQKAEAQEKRVESKKRRLAIDSSSESEENSDRISMRSKKIIRKPRTRSSINSKTNESDSGEDDNDSSSANKHSELHAKSRISCEPYTGELHQHHHPHHHTYNDGKDNPICYDLHTKNRTSCESYASDQATSIGKINRLGAVRQCKFSSSSSSASGGMLTNKNNSSKQQEPQAKSISNRKPFYLATTSNKMNKKRNRKSKSSSESEVDANRNSKKKKSLELNESDSGEDDNDSSSAKKRPHIMKVEETMTRSKRKRELEMEMANSKVLRNDKMIKCAIGVDKKGLELRSERKTDEKNSKTIDATKNTPTKSEDHKKKSNGSDGDNETCRIGILRKSIRNNKQSSSSNESEELSSEAETITERLRSRKSKLTKATSTDSDAHKDQKNDKLKPGCSNSSSSELNRKKSIKNTPKKIAIDPDMSEESRSQFPPGWEEQAYEYKIKLKIPARLITIGRPSWHRKSTSLPDLDPQHSSDASETFAEMTKKCAENNAAIDRVSNKKTKSCGKKLSGISASMANDSDNSANDAKSKSIIDLLHQRVSRPTGKTKKARINHNSNESRILPQSNEVELLPTPGCEGTNVFKPENVFETAVLKSRTRKEYKAMKTQEIIREVFGGEDRPASAPPFNFDTIKQEQEPEQAQEQDQRPESSQHSMKEFNSNTKLLTFDQQYEEYLQKMNVDYGEKIRKVKSAAGAKCSSAESGNLIPKIEQMDEDSLMDPDEESQDTVITECNRNNDGIKQEIQDEAMERGDTPSVLSELDRATPTSFTASMKTKKNRSNRHSRRKGSSGFDYIRKKKKPLTQQINPDGTPVIVKRRSAAVNYLEVKDENDITREIRSWVLNKGVGESVLHKAARLGYIDVVVYCLERLEMQPDQKDNAGYTPLHEACSRGLIDIAKVLLQYGANHSETAHSGIRPLHEAVDNRYLEIVRLLLSYGADPLLATYAGQTPVMLAEDDDEMVSFLRNHLIDVQNTGPNKMPWKFFGAWKQKDPDHIGYDIFDDLPEGMDKPHKFDKCMQENCPNKTTSEKMAKTPKRKLPLRRKSKQKDEIDGRTDEGDPSLDSRTGDSDTELFEIEESDAPLIPLYHLREEGTTKWVLLSDLCYLLKIKSKDTLMKMLCPGSSPSSSANQKDLLRELKMSEFLEKAICLQLLCAGEKLNIRSSKVTLVKYNDNVRGLLGVKTLTMRL